MAIRKRIHDFAMGTHIRMISPQASNGAGDGKRVHSEESQRGITARNHSEESQRGITARNLHAASNLAQLQLFLIRKASNHGSIFADAKKEGRGMTGRGNTKPLKPDLTLLKTHPLS